MAHTGADDVVVRHRPGDPSTVHLLGTPSAPEFVEMPGLRLTSEQVQRLCGVEPTICQLVLDSLVEAKFLCVKSERCVHTVSG